MVSPRAGLAATSCLTRVSHPILMKMLLKLCGNSCKTNFTTNFAKMSCLFLPENLESRSIDFSSLYFLVGKGHQRTHPRISQVRYDMDPRFASYADYAVPKPQTWWLWSWRPSASPKHCPTEISGLNLTCYRCMRLLQLRAANGWHPWANTTL